MEFFYNKMATAQGQPTRRQSTHGRSVMKMHTLTGEIDPPPVPDGNLNIFDLDGNLVRPANVGAGANAMAQISSTNTAGKVSQTGGWW